jgi:hypothetical protein
MKKQKGEKTKSQLYIDACGYSLAGDVDLALQTLRQAFLEDPDVVLEFIHEDPGFDLIRGDSRFNQLVAEFST